MIVKVEFKSSWLYSDGGAHGQSVGRLIRVCQEEFNERVSLQSRSTDKCVLEFDNSYSADTVTEKLNTILEKNIIKDKPVDQVCILTVEGTAKIITPIDVPAVPQTEDVKDIPPNNPESDIMSKINTLVGAENFKAFCTDIHRKASVIRQHHTEEVFLSTGYLFAVDSGCGLSESLRLLTLLLKDDGLLDAVDRVTERGLPAYGTGKEEKERFHNFVASITSVIGENSIVVFDISDWISHTSNNDFKDFLMQLFHKSGSNMYVFRTPVITDEKLNHTLRDFNDIILTKKVVFDRFTDDQLRHLAADMLKKYGFEMSDDSATFFTKKIEEEKSDGYFYGIHTVRKMVNEMISQLDAEAGNSSSTVTGDTLAAILSTEDDEPTGQKTLDRMEGMEQVKKQIKEITDQILFYRQNKMAYRPSMHMRFVGNPGTGKTTVARIIGRLLYENGVLSIGNFYEHKGRDLCGQYVGHTAAITNEICKEAYGSVLFIDEAYSLYRGEDFGRDYGREAIDTLIAEMENHSDDLVVILAGYPDEMDILLTANQGMKSRIPFTITFPNYNREELYNIFIRMANEYFVCDDGFMAHAKKYFGGISDDMMNKRDFGNARFVRNLYERVWGKAVSRCSNQRPSSVRLTVEDFNAAVSALDKNNTEKEKTRLGFC